MIWVLQHNNLACCCISERMFWTFW